MTSELKRILYVEDEADIQTIAVTVLEALGGFTMVCCNSGQQAIDVAPGAQADLVLLDVMMPGMDGPTTLKALRAIPQTATTPVVFMTAKVQASEIEQLKGLGALDVIPKPFDPMTLSDQVREIWQRWAGSQVAQVAVPAETPSTRNELQALFERYAADLPGTIAEIEALWARVKSGAERDVLKSLHRALHSLAGSGETFGYKATGATAKAMELALAPYLEAGAVPAAEFDRLSACLNDIKQAATARQQL